jgi:hypothetical protein
MQTPTVLSRDSLELYLNDHLLGATAGVELVRRTACENEGNEFAEELGLLAAEIDEDRAELVALIERLGCRIDRLKVAVGWSAEKLARLKPNGQLTGYSPLARLLELEGLIAGIHAKHALWSALREIAPETESLDEARLGALATRADLQLAAVERLQHAAARLALA